MKELVGQMRRQSSLFILSDSLLSMGLFFGLVFCAAQTAAQGETAEKIVDPQGLETVLKSTLSNNGQIQEAVQDIEIARAQLARANAALFPKASATLIGAPIFEERGGPTGSTVNWGKWGPLVIGGLEIAQPLYTFGQISSYQKAASSQITAREDLADVRRNEVVAQAKEFYYGFLMARELEQLVENLSSFLSEAVTTAEEQVKKKGKSNIKLHDVYRLKTALDDLKQKKLYASQAKQTAQKAVGWVSGQGSQLILKGVPLTPEKFEKKTLEEYLSTAKGKRPEFRALASGQQARLSLKDAKRAQSYPVLFLGAFGSAAWSPVRDRQQSIYANDPFNRIQGGVGLGLKFDLEFARHAAEASEEEAEAMKLKATESYAVPGIELQVRKAYAELEQAMEGLEIAKRRKDVARKWFVSSAMGWSIGVTPAKDLMEALEGDGEAKKNYIETVYQLNQALARLTQATGMEVTDLKYR